MGGLIVTDTYFLITASDGDVRIYEGDREEIIGQLDFDEETGEMISMPFVGRAHSADPLHWPAHRVLIIKGAVVTPRPVSVKYELS